VEECVQDFVLILKGSPRENGNSSTLANQVAMGAKEAGAEVESISLHTLDIRPCDACDTCHETGGVCIIKDDMQALYPKLRRASAIVVASPVYWFTISAQTKLCIDRWYAFVTPGGNDLCGKKFGFVLTFGDADLYTSGGINAIHTFESMCRYLKGEIVGMVYGTADKPGEVAGTPGLMDKAFQLGKKLVEPVKIQPTP
jgi:multimeric flavodoxin WrbA